MLLSTQARPSLGARGSGPAAAMASPGVPGVLVPPLAPFFWLPGALGAFLGPVSLRCRALVCFLGVPAASDRPPEASGVDFGSHFGSKNVHFDGLLWLFLRALFLAFWGCFRCCFSFRFLCFVAAREQGRRAKFDTPSMRKPVFSRCAPAPAQPQGRQQTGQKGIK